MHCSICCIVAEIQTGSQHFFSSEYRDNRYYMLALKLTIHRLFTILIQGMQFAIAVSELQRIDCIDYFVHGFFKTRPAYYFMKVFGIH